MEYGLLIICSHASPHVSCHLDPRRLPWQPSQYHLPFRDENHHQLNAVILDGFIQLMAACATSRFGRSPFFSSKKKKSTLWVTVMGQCSSGIFSLFDCGSLVKESFGCHYGLKVIAYYKHIILLIGLNCMGNNNALFDIHWLNFNLHCLSISFSMMT